MPARLDLTLEYSAAASERSATTVRDDDSIADSITTADLQQPILVGYAFGPKKMSTMATVMAEASRAHVEGVAEVANSDEKKKLSNIMMNKKKNAHHPLTSAALCLHQSKTASSQDGNNIVLSTGGLNNIVRYFRSSCSSVGSLDGEEANTISSTTGSIATTAPTRTSYASSSTTTYPVPVRVSFVPIDLNEPLEDQHGGRFDVILHKMTEDILCLSTADPTWNLQNPPSQDPQLRSAIQRISRLHEYHKTHNVCLADDPTHVEVVMSRSAICNKLQHALVGVKSTSGLDVQTPPFVDYKSSHQEFNLAYPLIAKPLPAAGTKKSHCMGIVLNATGLCKVQTPCILQEYANHDCTLFKVYVLGDDIHVFSRPSLPNLPCTNDELERIKPYVEFDSQKPYPGKAEFGIFMQPPPCKRARSNGGSTLPTAAPVTSTEVAPIVHALRRAFGLELFGFDILKSHDYKLMVVDVNYFPSYKEVSNFPALLAKFLVQLAVQKRKGASTTTTTTTPPTLSLLHDPEIEIVKS